MSRIHIVAAENVEVPSYLTLVDQGFELNCDARGQWTAKRGDTMFSAESPLELLGLVSMYDARGPQWKASYAEIEAFLARFPK